MVLPSLPLRHIAMQLNNSKQSVTDFQSKRMDIAFVDCDKSEISGYIYDYLNTNHNVKKMKNDKSLMQETLYYSQEDMVIKIPKGFGDKALKNGGTERFIQITQEPGSYGYIYVDTGAMYRAMALYFLRQGIDSHDEAAIGRACETVSISLEYENGIQQVYLNGENVSSELRTEAVGNMASNTSVYAPVRKKLVELQRELAGRRDVVMDGRDIGTAVLPDATLKVYLTASSHVRAERRYKELTERGESCSLEAIEQDIIERDYRDMHRELSPLKQAEDAILLDTSALNFEEVMREMEKLVEAAKKNPIAVGNF